MLQLDRYNITSRTTTTSTRGGVGGGVDHDEFDGGRSVDTKSSRGTTVSDDRVVREKELHDLRSKKLAKCLREQFEHNANAPLFPTSNHSSGKSAMIPRGGGTSSYPQRAMSNPRAGRSEVIHHYQNQPRRRHSNSPARDRYISATTPHSTPIGKLRQQKPPMATKTTTEIATTKPPNINFFDNNSGGSEFIGGRGGFVRRTASYQQTPQKEYMVDTSSLNDDDSRNPVPVYRTTSRLNELNDGNDDDKRDDITANDNNEGRQEDYRAEQDERVHEPDYGYIEYASKKNRTSNSSSKGSISDNGSGGGSPRKRPPNSYPSEDDSALQFYWKQHLADGVEKSTFDLGDTNEGGYTGSDEWDEQQSRSHPNDRSVGSGSRGRSPSRRKKDQIPKKLKRKLKIAHARMSAAAGGGSTSSPSSIPSTPIRTNKKTTMVVGMSPHRRGDSASLSSSNTDKQQEQEQRTRSKSVDGSKSHSSSSSGLFFRRDNGRDSQPYHSQPQQPAQPQDDHRDDEQQLEDYLGGSALKDAADAGMTVGKLIPGLHQIKRNLKHETNKQNSIAERWQQQIQQHQQEKQQQQHEQEKQNQQLHEEKQQQLQQIHNRNDDVHNDTIESTPVTASSPADGGGSDWMSDDWLVPVTSNSKTKKSEKAVDKDKKIDKTEDFITSPRDADGFVVDGQQEPEPEVTSPESPIGQHFEEKRKIGVRRLNLEETYFGRAAATRQPPQTKPATVSSKIGALIENFDANFDAKDYVHDDELDDMILSQTTTGTSAENEDFIYTYRKRDDHSVSSSVSSITCENPMLRTSTPEDGHRHHHNKGYGAGTHKVSSMPPIEEKESFSNNHIISTMTKNLVTKITKDAFGFPMLGQMDETASPEEEIEFEFPLTSTADNKKKSMSHVDTQQPLAIADSPSPRRAAELLANAITPKASSSTPTQSMFSGTMHQQQFPGISRSNSDSDVSLGNRSTEGLLSPKSYSSSGSSSNGKTRKASGGGKIWKEQQRQLTEEKALETVEEGRIEEVPDQVAVKSTWCCWFCLALLITILIGVAGVILLVSGLSAINESSPDGPPLNTNNNQQTRYPRDWFSPSQSPMSAGKPKPASDGDHDKTEGSDDDGIESEFVIPTYRLNSLRLLLEPVSGINILSDTSSPQYAAMEWLANKDPAVLNFDDTPTSELNQRYIVSLLYFATYGWDWDVQYGFLADSSVCDWNDLEESNRVSNDGIVCNDQDEVVQIVLADNGLRGSLPWEISLLSQLQVLYLPGNKIDGTIPTQIGKLSSLRHLGLVTNNIHGSLPTEVGLLRKIRHFDLGSNRLDGNLPTELGNLSSLNVLALSDNLFSGYLPSELGNLTNLKHLSLNSNRFIGSVPKEIGSLSLDLLNLRSNRFYGDLDEAFCGEDHHQFYAFWADCGGKDENASSDDVAGGLTCSCCTHCCQGNKCCRQQQQENDDDLNISSSSSAFQSRQRNGDFDPPCCTLDVFSNCKSN